ncbi:unnamed protein product [Pylaiella littoralis]
MHMNFHLAFEKLSLDTQHIPEDMRETIFRYDDTNPEAESQEYIDSIREDLEWMGWKPAQTTYSSDSFQLLYELAIKLIEGGKAYVCHQTKDDIFKCREIAKANAANLNTNAGDPCSPWRNRPIQENLDIFEKMRTGQLDEGSATLRLKMDMTSPNPNMWDQVAYRIRYIPHPHAGDKWCVYPTYDYTHCLVDSLEDIDYSICTLEFETRRESYFWLLEALELYRPKVYEFARLNITRTLLSKRKLLKLVKGRKVRGWDDPRMPTIKGLRRRGYTAEILNKFCEDIGVTRNDNLIEVEKLEHWARSGLNVSSRRVMGALSPVKVTLTNLEETREVEALDVPFAPEAGSHKIRLTKTLYIDASDFRREDSKDYFGLAPGKMVGLKYCSATMRCDRVVDGEGGASAPPVELICSLGELSQESSAAPAGDVGADAATKRPGGRPKGNISWVSAEEAVRAEVRLYSHLFTVDSPDDRWEEQINPESEVVVSGAVVDPSVLEKEHSAGTPLQLERIGFFVVDKDSTPELLVLNRTVTLKEATGKSAVPKDKSRKELQARQAAEKEARKRVPPQEMFVAMTDLYSAFDDQGVPTTDQAGEPLSKSAIKKLKKEWDKQKKLYEKSQE